MFLSYSTWTFLPPFALNAARGNCIPHQDLSRNVYYPFTPHEHLREATHVSIIFSFPDLASMCQIY